MNRSVRPGDDFFEYANGHWVHETTIPEDQTGWGSFQILADKAVQHVREILESSNDTKIGKFYQSFVDTARIERLGTKPLDEALAKITNLKAKHEYAQISRNVRP